MVKRSPMNKLLTKLILIGLCCAATLSHAEAAPGLPDRGTGAHSSQAKILHVFPKKKVSVRPTDYASSSNTSVSNSSLSSASVQLALDIACAYTGSYQSKNAELVRVFCSDRFLARTDPLQALKSTFNQSGRIVLKKITVKNLATAKDMVLVREDIDWGAAGAKAGISAGYHNVRILRMVPDGQGWTVDDDQAATDDVNDVAHEVVMNRLGVGEGIAINTDLEGDALVASLLSQVQTQYSQKYNYYMAVAALGWALTFARQDISKTTGADQSLANVLNVLAYAEVSAGNYAAAVNDKPTSLRYYQDALQNYQDYLSLVKKNAALSTPPILMLAHDQLGAAYQGLGQDDQAAPYRQMALRESTTLNNQALIGEALEAAGLLQAKTAGKGAELKFYQDYCQQQRATNNGVALAAGLLTLGVSYRKAGDYAKALSIFEEEKRLESQLGDAKGVADALMYISGLYDYEVDFANAKSCDEQAKAIYESLHNDVAVAEVWRCLSHLDYEQGQLTEALEYAFKGLKLAQQQNNLPELVRLYDCIGSTFEAQGDFRQASNFSTACERNAAILNDSVFENAAFGSLANLFLDQGDYDQAFEQMTQCEALAGRVSDPAEVAQNFRLMANILDKKGDYVQALQYIERAIKMDQSHGPSWEAAAIYVAQANTFVHQGNRDKALDAYVKGFDIARKARAWPVAIRAEESIGVMYGHQHRFPEALLKYQETLKLIEPSDLVDLSNCYADIGYVCFRMSRYDEAAQACRTAIRYIETMRSQVAGGAHEQQLFFQNQLSPYQTLTRILLAQHRNQEAFSCLEQSRARVVREAFGRQPDRTAFTPDEQAQSHILTTSLVSLDRQILALRRRMLDAPALIPLEASQSRVRLENELWQTILYNRHVQPEAPHNNQPITCADAFQMLPNERTAFLEYAVLYEVTYLFVLTKQGLHTDCQVYRIDHDASELTALVKQFRDGVAARDDRAELHLQARHLYETLLGGPVKDQLKGITTLCIVPDGPLWDLPFQALQPSDEHYVIDDQTLFFTPSLTVLREMRLNRPSAHNHSAPMMLAVGNPALTERTESATGLCQTAIAAAEVMNDLFRPLPQAESQVRNIAALYGKSKCKVLVGKDANADRIKSEMEKYRMLQFATHGVANTVNPMYSYLLLSQAHEGPGEDGMLFATDVMKMHLNAQLVVLAACDTARGQVSPGEGLVGMTWAFLHAGCPHVVASQWQIDAGPTTKLMVDFHKNLLTAVDADADGAAITKGLRDAALKLRRTKLYSHPYYWAPFVLTGNGFSESLIVSAIHDPRF